MCRGGEKKRLKIKPGHWNYALLLQCKILIGSVLSIICQHYRNCHHKLKNNTSNCNHRLKSAVDMPTWNMCVVQREGTCVSSHENEAKFLQQNEVNLRDRETKWPPNLICSTCICTGSPPKNSHTCTSKFEFLWGKLKCQQFMFP